MAYDEDLADRAREVMPADAEVTERKMFGGLAFLLRGHMFAGIVGSELMVRIGEEAGICPAERAGDLPPSVNRRVRGRLPPLSHAGTTGPSPQRTVDR